MHILLIEDDAMIGAAVRQALLDAAYAVDWEKDGAVALRLLELETYDLVLLDLSLPTRDGLDVLKAARGAKARAPRVPIIILSARDAIEDRIAGLDLGADDYLVKPFAVAELLARLRVLVRRQSGTATATIGTGRVSLNLATKIASVSGQEYRLSNREFALLRALLQRPGAILSRAELEDKIYGGEGQIESNAVEYIIHGLRKKLGGTVIQNLRGMGWFVDREVL